MKRRVILIFCILFYAGVVCVWLNYQNQIARQRVLNDLEDQMRPPKILFSKITQDAGIDFVHDSGSYDGLLFPEITGPGCGFFDFDNDGDQDILLVNSGKWPHRSSDASQPTVIHSLYENDGLGHFEDVGEKMGLVARSYGQGVCFGDFDNDGFEDVYITCAGPNVLFHNENGKGFVDVTVEAGVGCAEWSVSAAFVDYDSDGLLDLFVGNFVQWDLAKQEEVRVKVEKTLEKIGKMFKEHEALKKYEYDPQMFHYGKYGKPDLYKGNFCVLYRNLDAKRFRDVSAEAGVQVKNNRGLPVAKALAVGVNDYNDDGWPDIAIANDNMPDFLLKNLGNGTFEEVGQKTGMANDYTGQARAGMGTAWADFRNDGSIALAVSNFASEVVGLYHSQDPQRRVFVDVALAQGMGAASRMGVMWGLFFFDYDLDGRLDFYLVNGHTYADEAETHEMPYRQKAVLYWNRGPNRKGYFLPVGTEFAGNKLFTPIVGRGAAYGDIDQDGDLDILVVANQGPANLYRNNCNGSNQFLRLKLSGTKSNRSAIGAKVRVLTGEVWQRREVTSGGSYASQSELPVTFGLGSYASADEVEITWPSGLKQTFQQVAGGKTIEIIEGQELNP